MRPRAHAGRRGRSGRGGSRCRRRRRRRRHPCGTRGVADRRHHVVMHDASAFARALDCRKVDVLLSRELTDRRRSRRGGAGGGGSRRRLAGRSCARACLRALVDLANRIADRDDVVYGREQLGHDACNRRRKLTVRLIGEDLYDGLVLGNGLPHGDEPFADGAFYDALAELWHRHFGGHWSRTIA